MNMIDLPFPAESENFRMLSLFSDLKSIYIIGTNEKQITCYEVITQNMHKEIF